MCVWDSPVGCTSGRVLGDGLLPHSAVLPRFVLWSACPLSSLTSPMGPPPCVSHSSVRTHVGPPPRVSHSSVRAARDRHTSQELFPQSTSCCSPAPGKAKKRAVVWKRAPTGPAPSLSIRPQRVPTCFSNRCKAGTTVRNRSWNKSKGQLHRLGAVKYERLDFTCDSSTWQGRSE